MIWDNVMEALGGRTSEERCAAGSHGLDGNVQERIEDAIIVCIA
jgi:hypothetical protein